MSATDTNSSVVVVPQSKPAPAESGMVRQEFGAIVYDPKAETSSNVLAAQAAAAVQARAVMALQRPRNMDDARVRMLAACKRPLFAEKAIYAKPVGKKLNKKTGNWEEAFAEGLSIRFAEEAIRALRNVMTESQIIYDDARKRIIRVSVTDLEDNNFHSKDVTIEKTVERSKLRQGQLALATRVNSEGRLVFIVEATDDDLAVKAGSLTAKAIRDKVLMLVPSDIQEEAKATIYATQEAKDKSDPAAARKKLIDSFASVGVLPEALTEYVGHDLGQLVPQELQHLRAIYSAISEGEATWADVLEQKRDFEGEKAARDKKKAEADAAATAAKASSGAQTAEPAAKGKANVNDLAKEAKAKREGAAQPKPEDNISKPVIRQTGEEG